jgi:hypothetical protein
MNLSIAGSMAMTLSLVASTAYGAADPALKCGIGKLKEAVKYGQCRLGAESKAVKSAGAADFSKCESKLASKWEQLETKSGGLCPTSGDQSTVKLVVDENIFELAQLVSFDIELVCAFTDTGQVGTYGEGDDGSVQSGAPFGYRDNGDGTITDLNTGLMWEKKVNIDQQFQIECTDESGSCANPHDADNSYSWSFDATAFDGTIVTVFLEQMNNRCNANTAVPCTSNFECNAVNEFDNGCGFAGHRDWRIPNIRELATLSNAARAEPNPNYLPPTTHAAFNRCGEFCIDIKSTSCSCTRQGPHFSSTSTAGPYTAYPAGAAAWSTGFADVGISPVLKTDFWFVRAVRGGY